MPARHRTKQYTQDGHYHIYNRGVEKRLIFLDGQDYGVFLSYLKEYLLPKDEKELHQKFSDPNISYKERDKILKLLRLNNFTAEITLFAYCLMPNHFHLLVKQNGARSINKFMGSLCTRYSMYFNRKYKRIGNLYQDIYKAVLVSTDEQFLYLSSYIHHQALPNKPSSYPEYLGQRHTKWIHPEEILSFFSKTNPRLSYKAFIESPNDLSPIQYLVIDD